MIKKIPVVFFIILLFPTACELVHQFNWETEFDKGNIYVSVLRGSDFNEGRRGKPVRSINAGIARALEKGYDTIFIETGVYKEGNGGFVPAGANGVLINKTNLNFSGGWTDDFSRQGGDDERTVIKGETGSAVKHLFSIFDGTNLSFENLTFENGLANVVGDETGAALFIDNSSNIKIINCVFKNNSAINGGGAVYTDKSSGIIVTGCRFEGNSVTVGGGEGGAILFSDSNNCSILSTSFKNNSADDNGGAVTFKGGGTTISTFVINGSSFSSNSVTTGTGGAVYFEMANDVEIEKCTFSKNRAVYGGAVGMLTCSNYLISSNFNNNGASGGVGGGVMWVSASSNVTINGGTYQENFTTVNSGTGAFYFGNTSNITISDALILDTSSNTYSGTEVLCFVNAGGFNTITLERNTILNSGSAIFCPEQILSFWGNANVTIRKNTIGGKGSITDKGVAIYEAGAINSPYILEDNIFKTTDLSALYRDNVNGTFTDIADLNDPAQVGADSASGNTVE